MKNLRFTPRTSTLDMKKEFDEFISSMPYCLVVRANRQVRCICYNPIVVSFNNKCPLCLGTGWVKSIERYRHYTRVGSVPETLPRLIRTFEPGTVAIESRYFYLPSEARPEEMDLVVRAAFNRLGVPLPGTMEFYKINHVDPKFDENGRIVYYRASTEIDPVDSEVKNIYVHMDADSIVYIPTG